MEAENAKGEAREEHPSHEELLVLVGRGRVMFGWVPFIHGPEAVTHSAEITVYEAELLCQTWADWLLGLDEDWAYNAMSSSSSIHIRPYAGARIDYFGTILGEQRVREIVDEVYRDFDPPDEPGLFQCNIDWPRTLAAGFFGACPQCGHPGDLVNIGPTAWLVCDADSVKWRVWDDVVPDWREQDPTRWVEAIRRTVDYREVTPAYPARRNHLVIVKNAPENTDMG